MSLWDQDRLSAWRHSVEKADNVKDYRPTVTFNCIVTLEEYGCFSSPFVDGIRNPPLDIGKAIRSIGRPSSHLTQTSHKEGLRSLIFLSNYLEALRALAVHDKKGSTATSVMRGCEDATDLFVGLFDRLGRGAQLTNRLLTSPYLSPFLLLYARSFLVDREALGHAVSVKSRQSLRTIDTALDTYFERSVERLMARRHVKEDAGFDAASLCFALKGLLSYRRDGLRDSAYFSACVQAIVDGQNGDGTWPDGVCALVEDNADTLQQPSAKIALELLNLSFEPRMLVRATERELRVLEHATAAFERTASYLVSTYVEQTSSGNASGWVSDRVRWPRTSDTWITTLAARFFLAYRSAIHATQRANVLNELGARWPNGCAADVSERRKRWQESVVDPDALLRPCATIFEKVLDPVLEQQAAGSPFVFPGRSGVSMIIFGPPGSGKTFFIDTMAACLGWPVVDLNPGHFIKDGAELIESRAHQIFELIGRLNHAVVFFDECDELFLDRKVAAESARNVLSFVTASMLPKLQQLHDKRRIVFVLATNYLHRVDPAVRRQGRFDHLLLFDRPDASARRKHLRKIRRLSGLALKEATALTAGLTPKEIVDGDSSSWSSGSRADYSEWCSQQAGTEIDAAGYAAEIKKGLRRRWTAFGFGSPLPNP